MDNQKVSIITPIYNSERFIKQTVDSVLQQSYANFEFIIIDDHSQDSSFDIINSYKDKRINIIRLKENVGAGAARNEGIKRANGKYIAFLDSDDIWHKEKLKKQIDFMTFENVVFCFSSFYLIDEQGSRVSKYLKALEKVDYKMMLKNNYIGCLTAIYDCKALGKIYMSEERKRQDWGLWLRILTKTKVARSIPEPLAYYRVRKDSLSSNKWQLLKSNFQFYKEQLGFNSFKSLMKMLCFLFYYFQYKVLYTREVT